MTELTIHGDIKVPSQRIVSLAPSITEMLYYLGLGGSVVGVTEQCDYPPAVKSTATIGSFVKPDVECIVKLSPDIIIGLGDLHKHLPEIIDSGQTAFITLEYVSVQEVLDAMEVIAGLAENPQQAAGLVADLRRRVENIRTGTKKLNPVRTLFVMHDDPVYTPGRGSYMYDTLNIAGALQMPYNNAQYERITLEQVVEFDPEVVLACGRHRDDPPRSICPGCQAENPICIRIVDDIAERPRWRDTAAAKNGKVLALPCDWLCRAGPRMIDGMEKIGEILNGI